MGRFDFGQASPTPEQERPGREVGGSYRCQQCDESVRSATYHRDELELTWVCSKGHVSSVKGLDI